MNTNSLAFAEGVWQKVDKDSCEAAKTIDVMIILTILIDILYFLFNSKWFKGKTNRIGMVSQYRDLNLLQRVILKVGVANFLRTKHSNITITRKDINDFMDKIVDYMESSDNDTFDKVYNEYKTTQAKLEV